MWKQADSWLMGSNKNIPSGRYMWMMNYSNVPVNFLWNWCPITPSLNGNWTAQNMYKLHLHTPCKYCSTTIAIGLQSKVIFSPSSERTLVLRWLFKNIKFEPAYQLPLWQRRNWETNYANFYISWNVAWSRNCDHTHRGMNVCGT